MTFDLVIKNGTLVTPHDTFVADIAVADGQIAALGMIFMASESSMQPVVM